MENADGSDWPRGMERRRQDDLADGVIPYLLGQGLAFPSSSTPITNSMSTCRARIPGCIAIRRRRGSGFFHRRWALMQVRRGAAEPRLPELLAKMSPVDFVVVEGFKRERHRKIEVHRLAAAKPLLFPDDPDIVGIATDAVASPSRRFRPPISMISRPSPRCCCGLRHRSKPCWRNVPPKAERQMVQLSDDCFAFGGPLMAVDQAVAIVAARVAAVQDIETVALAEADGANSRGRYFGLAAAASIHQFRRRWLCRGRGDLPLAGETRLAVAGRVAAGADAGSVTTQGVAVRDFYRRAAP